MKNFNVEYFDLKDWENDSLGVVESVSKIVYADPFSWSLRKSSKAKTKTNVANTFKKELDKADKNFIAVGYSKDKPVSFLLLNNIHHNVWEIAYVMTDLTERRKGFAYLTLESVMTELKHKGAESIISNVFDDNKNSVQFHEYAGFVKMREEAFTADSDGKQDMFRINL